MKKIKTVHAASGHTIAIFGADANDGHPGPDGAQRDGWLHTD